MACCRAGEHRDKVFTEAGDSRCTKVVPPSRLRFAPHLRIRAVESGKLHNPLMRRSAARALPIENTHVIIFEWFLEILMSRKLALGAIWAIVFSPSLIFAQDRKTDPDPAVLPSARTMALAAVDANYDLGSPRTPFPARFAACAGKLSAARQDGRAMPLGKPEIDQAISSFRSLAVELLAHRNKLTSEAVEPLSTRTLLSMLPEPSAPCGS